jgi:hypothetical protein
MNSLHDEAIREAFDDLFKDENGNSSVAQIQADDGWVTIIGMAAKTIQNELSQRARYNTLGFDLGECYFTEIKEKYGTLEISFSISDPFIDGVIDMARNMSSHVCEVTGRPGRLYEKAGFLKTLSLTTAAKLGYTKSQ